jgi:Polysaccharide biosynthesis C-terminal domain
VKQSPWRSGVAPDNRLDALSRSEDERDGPGGLVANLVLAVILVPPLGVTGGAIAFAVSLVLWNALFVRATHRHVGVNATAFYRRRPKPRPTGA